MNRHVQMSGEPKGVSWMVAHSGEMFLLFLIWMYLHVYVLTE